MRWVPTIKWLSTMVACAERTCTVNAGLGPGALAAPGAWGFDPSPGATRWFPQVVDHFENGPAPEKTWYQAYLLR